MKKTVTGTYFSNYQQAKKFCDKKKVIIIFSGSEPFAGYLVVSKKQLELYRKP